ncbi:MAG: hypothetical protein AUG03_07375 [Acidobacteria bacterium 13_1_20CM_2_68_14]|nr:MAG: hypothetical protein AUG03_07375 [Acidobacteria bacterium 13_1_20CM_2_68_14]
MTRVPATPSGSALSRLVRVSIARPRLTVALGLALAVLAAVYTARELTFQTSSVQLMPPQRPYIQRFKQALKEFGELNDLVVVVEAPSVERAQAFADRLGPVLEALPGAGRVAWRVDPDLFKGHALLYLSTERLGELRDKIVEHQGFVEQYAGRPTLAGLLDGVSDEITRRFARGFIDLGLDGSTPHLDPGFVDTLLGVVADGLDGGTETAAPWARVFTTTDDGARSGYFLSADKRLLFILVEPRREAANFTDNEHFLTAIRGAITALRREYPGVAAGVTGTPALSNDEMLTAFHDSTLATALAFALTLGFLLAVCRRVVEPLVMLAVLVVSLAWSLALITLTVGHLTVFSVMFISLLIGIGIDYGVYVFFRYQEELELGHPPARALEIMARRTGPGIFFGALTGAGTFGVLMLTEFRGVQEFGFIAGIAILMAFLAMMTVFPAVLMWMRRGAGEPGPPAARAPAGDGRPARRPPRPRAVLLVTAALTVASLAALPSVRFDYNRLHLQARGTESVIWEQKIMQSRRSGFAALTIADSLADLRAKQEAFGQLPAVAEVVSVLTLVPSDQPAKIAILRDIAPLVSPLRVGSDAGVNPAPVRRALETLRGRLALAIREADPGATADTLRSAHDRAGALLARLEAEGADAGLTSRLARVQASLRDDFAVKLRRLQDNVEPTPLTVHDLPEELTRRFVGRTGRFLVRIYPAIDTWDREGGQEFVGQLRRVDAGVTGSPVISYEAGRLMEAAYFHGTLYAVVLVAALAILMLRRAGDALLALAPLVLGTLWTIAVMHVCGLPFNLANVWGLPLIMGASAEFGLNVTLRYREAAAGGTPMLTIGTVRAVVLNGLTTIGGFGSLMIARHQGIFGLGLLLTVGAGAGLVSALVVLPVLLQWTSRSPSRRLP